MTRFFHQMRHKAGLQPGSVVYVGKKKTEPVKITVIDYDAENLREFETQIVEECLDFRDSKTITWINISGIHDVSVIEKIGEQYGLSPLIMEDIVNTNQRPKYEEENGIIFAVVKMLFSAEENLEIGAEQVSVIITPTTVITFQEKEGDVLTPVRERIKKTVPRVRFLNSDYLAYAIIDAIVDYYFMILEQVGERIERLEGRLIDNPTPDDLQDIYKLRSELLYMRRAVWPLREMVNGMERSESSLIHKETNMYLRDLYEHVIQIIDTVETAREMVSGLLDIYLSSVSNKMNQVMKVLTIIATIFIPLGFLAGVYGMNFDSSVSPFNMPELSFKYGYPLFWGIAILIGAGLFIFFRRKKWL